MKNKLDTQDELKENSLKRQCKMKISKSKLGKK